MSLVRAVAAGLLLAVGATSCGLGAGEAGSCAGSVEWDGTEYLPHETTEAVPLGSDLGRVRRLTCDDGVGGGEDGLPRFGEAVTIPGVDPSVAFVLAGDEDAIYASAPPEELPPQLKQLLA